MAYFYGNNGFGVPMQGQPNGTSQQNGMVGNGMQPNQMNFGYPMMSPMNQMMPNNMYMQPGYQQPGMMMPQPMMTSGNQNDFFNQQSFTQPQPTLGAALEKKSVKQMMNEPLDDLLGSAIDSIAVNNTMPASNNGMASMNNMMPQQNNFFLPNGSGYNMTLQPMTSQPMNNTPQAPQTNGQSPAVIQDVASQFFASLGGVPNNPTTTPTPTYHPAPNTVIPVTPVMNVLTPTMPSMMPSMTPVNPQPSPAADDDDFFSSAAQFQTTNPKPDPTPSPMPQHFNTNPQPNTMFNNTAAPTTNIQSVADQFFANLSGLPLNSNPSSAIPTNFNAPTTSPNMFNTTPTSATASPFAQPLQPEPANKPSPFSQVAFESSASLDKSTSSSGNNSRRGSLGSSGGVPANMPAAMAKLTTSTSVTPTHSVSSSPLHTNDNSVKRTNSRDKLEVAGSAPVAVTEQNFDSFFAELGKQQTSDTSTVPPTVHNPLFSMAESSPPMIVAPMLTTPVDLPVTPAVPVLSTPTNNTVSHSPFEMSVHHAMHPSTSDNSIPASLFMPVMTPVDSTMHSSTPVVSEPQGTSTNQPMATSFGGDHTPVPSVPSVVEQPTAVLQVPTDSSMTPVTTPFSLTPDVSTFKPHVPLSVAQASPQNSPYSTNDTSSSGSHTPLATTPNVPVVNNAAELPVNIQALADQFFSSFQLPSLPSVPNAVGPSESVTLDVPSVNGNSPQVSHPTTPAVAAQPTVMPMTPVEVPTPQPPTETNLFSLYESIKAQKKHLDKPVQLDEMLNDSMNLLYQVMDAQNKAEPQPVPPKTELTFDDDDMGEFVSAGTMSQPLSNSNPSVGLTPVMLPVTALYPMQTPVATNPAPTVDDWDFPSAPVMNDISIPSTNTAPSKGLHVTEDLFASVIGLKKSTETVKDPRARELQLQSQVSPQSPSSGIRRDAPQPKRGTVIMAKIPRDNAPTTTPASSKKVMPGIGPSSISSKTPAATAKASPASSKTSSKQSPPTQTSKTKVPKGPIPGQTKTTISRTPTLTAKSAGAKTSTSPKESSAKRGATVMGTIPGTENGTKSNALKSSTGADDFFGSFNGGSPPLPTASPSPPAAKKSDMASLLMDLYPTTPNEESSTKMETVQPSQKSLFDIFATQQPVPLTDSLNGSAETKPSSTLGDDEFNFADFRGAKSTESITKSTFLAFYDPTAAKTDDTPAPVIEANSSPSVPRVELPFASSTQLSAHLFFAPPKTTAPSTSVSVDDPIVTGEDVKVPAKLSVATAGDVYKWQQCLEKAHDEFSRAVGVLENIRVQHEAAKELDISTKVMKSEKIKTYFAALNQIYTVASRILRSISTDPGKYGSLASPMGASLPFLVDQTSQKWKNLQEKAKSLGYEHMVTPGEKLSVDDEQQVPNSERFCRLCMTRVNAYDARTCHWMHQDELYHVNCINFFANRVK